LQLEAAIAHFSVAVKINPQYASIWFRMGCCALGTNELALAQRCFSRVVQLFPDDSEAWNNLAAVYIKQDKKDETRFKILTLFRKEAFKALKESLKNRNDNWKVWENFVLVAIVSK
jgi:tetratricopeptide (TPR) repeat protein